MTHQEQIRYVRVAAARWLRVCPCGGRMYLIDDTRFGSAGEFRLHHTRTWFCGECSRTDAERYPRVKARIRRLDPEARKARNARYRRRERKTGAA